MSDLSEMETILEAVLFASGDPVPLDRLSEILAQDKKTTRAVLETMQYKWSNSVRGLMVRELDGSWQLCTKPELDPYIARLGTVRKKQGLTPAAYEVLSIIAYKQPVTRLSIEQIRGVNSDSVLLKLSERNLIREAGREDAPGKPKLYETTEEFLRVFGFSSLKELPVPEIQSTQEIMDRLPVD